MRLASMLAACILSCFPPSTFAQNANSTTSSSVCGRADPAYIRTAEETGGIPMFLQRSEAGKAFHLVRESSRNNVETVLWATGTLDTRAQIKEIPVDSFTQRITFTFSAAVRGSKLVLTSPAGSILTANSNNAEVTELTCGRIVTVSSPEPGIWRAEITGTGKFWMEAEAETVISIISARFVKQGGRIGHEGMFPIQGQPLADKPANFEINLAAENTRTVEFHLADEDGSFIQKVELRPLNADRSWLEFGGTLALPKVPFRFAVTGHDSNGKPYQRFSRGLFHAETVEVIPALDFDEISSGSSRRAFFVVRNAGEARTFKIMVTDAHRFASLSPVALKVGTGDSEKFFVDLIVPDGTAEGTGDDVVVVATSTDATATSNSCVAHISVVAPKASP